jgi:Methyltransferase FkbM domain
VSSSFSDSPPAFIKVDVQGYELELLKGAEKLVYDGVLCVKLEASFVLFYKGQPNLQAVLDFMFMRKFDFVKIKPKESLKMAY